ncbi:hypothetical protein [Streptomyces sp. NPDC052114]
MADGVGELGEYLKQALAWEHRTTACGETFGAMDRQHGSDVSGEET